MPLLNEDDSQVQARRGGTYKGQLNGAAETCCCSFVFGGPAVVGTAGEWEVWFGFIGGGGHLFSELPSMLAEDGF